MTLVLSQSTKDEKILISKTEIDLKKRQIRTNSFEADDVTEMFFMYNFSVHVLVSMVAPRASPTEKHYSRPEQREHRCSTQHDQLAQLP